jgi:PIN domain nuclease of toxin-antitoxin system
VKPGNSVVLDSSAVLALVLKEPGGNKVGDLLVLADSDSDLRIAISVVNWCEILTRLYRDHASMTIQELEALLGGVELVPFARAEADLAADYSRTHPELSLGDRACLALTKDRDATAWTTDKAWNRIKVGVSVEALR